MLKAFDTPKSLRHADHHFTRYAVMVERSVTLDDVTSFAFVVNVVRSLNILDELQVISKDGSWEALLRLEHKSTGFVKWRVLRHWTADASGQKAKPGAIKGKVDASKLMGVAA